MARLTAKINKEIPSKKIQHDSEIKSYPWVGYNGNDYVLLFERSPFDNSNRGLYISDETIIYMSRLTAVGYEPFYGEITIKMEKE